MADMAELIPADAAGVQKFLDKLASGSGGSARSPSDGQEHPLVWVDFVGAKRQRYLLHGLDEKGVVIEQYQEFHALPCFCPWSAVRQMHA